MLACLLLGLVLTGCGGGGEEAAGACGAAGGPAVAAGSEGAAATGSPAAAGGAQPFAKRDPREPDTLTPERAELVRHLRDVEAAGAGPEADGGEQHASRSRRLEGGAGSAAAHDPAKGSAHEPAEATQASAGPPAPGWAEEGAGHG